MNTTPVPSLGSHRGYNESSIIMYYINICLSVNLVLEWRKSPTTA